MKLLIKILFLVLLATGISHAQHTTVTAQVKDPTGVTYRTCSGSANFVGQNTTPGSPPYTLGGGAFQTVVPISCDGAGRFQISLADNNIITPNPSQWRFSICSGTGVYPGPPICFNALITITGVSQDVTTSLQAVSAPLPPYSVTLETNGVLNGSQALLNLIAGSNIAIVDNGLGGVTISSSGGGGGPGGLPDPGSNGIVVRTALNTTAAVPNAAIGSYYVSEGVSSLPATQQKAIYDTRDWMTCDGVTDASAGMSTLLATIGTQEATIRFVGTTNPTNSCRMGNVLFPGNITLDFSGGGSLQLISSATAPGGAGFVNGTSAECELGPTHTSCSTSNAANGSTTLSLTAGNTVVVIAAPYPGFTFKFTSVTDTCNNFYIHVQQSTAGQPRNTGAWVASNIKGGTCTITANANGGLTHSEVMVEQFSGMGPVVQADGPGATANADTTTMSAGPATVTAGSLVLGYGGQQFTPVTCTAGAGYVQPASLAGQTTNGLQCMEYQLSSAGGSQSATQTISAVPSGSWVYNMLALKPGNATATILGGIIDPDLHQIFLNADSATGHGTIDFTGANVLDYVHPEWWGATPSATQAVNNPAMQAAVWAAFGGGQTQARTNVSALSQYNRPLYLNGNYTISTELKFYSVIGFKVICNGRLAGGITQNGLNQRIIAGQSIAYGAFYDCSWTSSNNQDTSHPLIDLDYDGVTTSGDLRPQFIDFYNNTFIGNGVANIGVQIAKSGGAAQGSNINFYDPEILSFTTAGIQIGTPTFGAANALAIGIFNGDIQGCTKYGIANYSGGFIELWGTTFEGGFTTQTGADVYSQDSQGPVVLHEVRSESRKLCWCSNGEIYNSGTANQSNLITAGGSAPVGTIYTGNFITGDGAYYQVTTDSGGFVGVGGQNSQVSASGGSTTTLVDTNQTVAGAVTIKKFTTTETVTQSVTGASATELNQPASTATVTGTNGSTPITLGETFTQAVTGVTATQLAPTPGINTSSPLFLNNLSGTADSTHVWTGGTSGATYTPNAAPTFSATTMLITAATGAPDNSHDWVSTSGVHFTPTAVPASVNWTVNAFAGEQVAVYTGSNALCGATIASNTANTLTITPPWTTRFPYTTCSAPDNTSSFSVEPTFNHGTVSSGGMVLQYLNENVVQGGSDNPVFGGIIDGGGFPGGQLSIVIGGQSQGTNARLKNVTTTRTDWLNTGTAGFPQAFGTIIRDWDVNVVPLGARGPINWQYPTQGGSGGAGFLGPLHTDWGIRPLCWNNGTANVLYQGITNTSAAEVCIGGRSDPGAANSVSRNILEFPAGILGRPTPFGTDLNGTAPMQIQGGLATGAGTPTPIEFWIGGPAGASSNIPNVGTRKWYFAAPSGNFLADTDNAYDIGAAGANRPRNLYIAGKATLGSGSTVSISTGTASNADLAGELTFSGGTTSTSYTFTGTYVSAPECVITPRFDVGSSGRIWISTLSTTTLQLSAAAAETGTVGYICIGRN